MIKWFINDTNTSKIIENQLKMTELETKYISYCEKVEEVKAKIIANQLIIIREVPEKVGTLY